MRSILDRAAVSVTPAPEAPVEKSKYVPKPFKKAEDNQISAFEEEEVAPAQTDAPVEAPVVEEKPAEEAPAVEIDNKKKGSKKNHMGSMFDFLTFGDV